ncbi:relaxase/mobilization nuclease domain-containing protein [Streptomyces sp. NBC_01717]|uniref:relaxase/mobilization nuclease domain-containing protein n=1 Tax=Streptomyces sp. NBC_01717 TaxID=2975918 RepID=UPI002E32A039|nr:relaxase/mobilization nuclease domain-containing protein [Streptomyces sp. NBC_01717]
MVPDINPPGGRTIGLLKYLYRTSDIEAHIDPHIVAAYDPFIADPGRDPSATFTELAADLDQWVDALKYKAPAKHVWHCSVRTADTDRILSDEEWATVARRIVNATGIAPEGDEQACRWIAVRHAPDHIHLVATLVRADRTQPRRHKDATRAQAECREIEREFGLRQLKKGDGTAAKRPTSAERRKAERLGQEATSRELLREHVHRALAGAADETEFFDRLAAEGVRIKKRVAPSGDLLGYAIAIVGDRNADQEPIWYSGSKLAPDLSLPKIRERFKANGNAPEPPALMERFGESAPGRARRFAAEAVDTALTALASPDDEAVAAHLVGVGEVLDALTQTTLGRPHKELQDAARTFEHAVRSHIRGEQTQMYALRRAARQIVHSGPALGRGADGATTALVLDLLILTVIAAGHWHAAHHHGQQAEAARRTAMHLRTAYRAAAADPLADMRAYGERLTARTQQHHAQAFRSALPKLADRVQVEAGWPALTAVLDQAQRAGHDTTALLRKVSAQRELYSADSVSEVLVWRLYRLDLVPAKMPTAAPANQRTAAQDLHTVPPATLASTHGARSRQR